MLIDFSVSNFRSFAPDDSYGEQFFSTLAGKSKSLKNHEFADDFYGRVLKTTVLYGSNDAGKSNILKALASLQNQITLPTQDEDLLVFGQNGSISRFTPREKQFDLDPITRFRITIAAPIRDSESPSDTMRRVFRYELHRHIYGYVLQESLQVLEKSGEFSDVYRYYDDRVKSFDLEATRFDSRIFDRRAEDLQDARSRLESAIDSRKKVAEKLDRLEETSREIARHQKILNNLSEDGVRLQAKLGTADHLEKSKLYSQLEMIERMTYDEKCALDELNVKRRDLLEMKTKLEADYSQLTKNVESLSAQVDALNEVYLIAKSKIQDGRHNRPYQKYPFLSRFSFEGRSPVSFGHDDITFGITKEEAILYAKTVYTWFESTLQVISTSGDALVGVVPQDIPKLSGLVRQFDIKVTDIRWVLIDNPDEIRKAVENISRDAYSRYITAKDLARKEKCGVRLLINPRDGKYLFDFWGNSLRLSKLVTQHGENAVFDLQEESDGTRRIIDLASILVEPDDDKVYIVDELDRRLHPSLTRLFLDIYLGQSSEKTQLIFTTHETSILKTDLFRKDEVWFVDNDDGRTHLHRCDSKSVRVNKSWEDMYLNGVFGGVPKTG